MSCLPLNKVFLQELKLCFHSFASEGLLVFVYEGFPNCSMVNYCQYGNYFQSRTRCRAY
jgi:hypothetical protein